jgi:hypothetical protein
VTCCGDLYSVFRAPVLVKNVVMDYMYLSLWTVLVPTLLSMYRWPDSFQYNLLGFSQIYCRATASAELLKDLFDNLKIETSWTVSS